jgi:hypothetical protein
MRPAFPTSEYYGDSAPSRTDRSTMNPAHPFALAARQQARAETVPVFTVIRSIEEEPDSAPAASPHLRRRPSARPPGHRLHDSRKFPHHQHGWLGTHRSQPTSTRFRAGRALRGFTPSVPHVLLSIPLTGPTPSGSTGTSRLCQGCSRPPRHLPDQPALSSYRIAATTRRRRSPTSTQTTAPHGARKPHSTPSPSPSVTAGRPPRPAN